VKAQTTQTHTSLPSARIDRWNLCKRLSRIGLAFDWQFRPR
jgi:hypothetical protein